MKMRKATGDSGGRPIHSTPGHHPLTPMLIIHFPLLLRLPSGLHQTALRSSATVSLPPPPPPPPPYAVPPNEDMEDAFHHRRDVWDRVAFLDERTTHAPPPPYHRRVNPSPEILNERARFREHLSNISEVEEEEEKGHRSILLMRVPMRCGRHNRGRGGAISNHNSSSNSSCKGWINHGKVILIFSIKTSITTIRATTKLWMLSISSSDHGGGGRVMGLTVQGHGWIMIGDREHLRNGNRPPPPRPSPRPHWD
ncbi:hypothetical protein QJS10_CPB13g01724 [Acorus calamus]|uniref:Uncharacterized protein n=1 Tax=Acorus calamus TaxID=4465 RepID=A0AAV9DHL6_ACOCL|nr:hypothetical protein QJS10_CPB13g01724 [Acorus calamus]